jgi:hypothetical protein
MEGNPFEFSEISGMALLIPIYVVTTVTSFYIMYGELDILVT